MDQLADGKNQFIGMTHDAAGNLINDGVSSYTYDAENRLITAGGVTYTYDGDGRRVKKSSGTLYWYDASGNVLVETQADSGGTWNEAHLYFGGKRILRHKNGGAVRYIFADYLGSASVVGNFNGTIMEELDFYPYGGTRVISSAESNAYKFTGKERDGESGLDYFGARYYSNKAGRFLTPDWARDPTPVPYADFNDPQTLNLYGYVRNNPATIADADGHCPWCVGALVGAVVGGGIEAVRQYRAGKGFNVAKIGGKALQGGVVGAVAVATGGASLIIQGGAVAAANTGAGIVSRATDNDSNTKALDKKQVAIDAAAGAAAGVAGGVVGQVARSEASAAQTSLQVQASQANNQIMQGIVNGNASQIAAGQAARAATQVEAAVINAGTSAVTGGARAGAKAAATVVVENVVKPESQ